MPGNKDAAEHWLAQEGTLAIIDNHLVDKWALPAGECFEHRPPPQPPIALVLLLKLIKTAGKQNNKTVARKSTQNNNVGSLTL